MLQFNKALYVSRQNTQELCQDVINKGHYLDIYGMTGLGKTEFLKWIHDNQKQHDTTFCCYVDLQSNNININNAIAEQLYDETIFPDDPFADFKQFSAQDEDLHNAFNNGLQTVLNSYKVVLCIDNTDSATSTWQTFEEKVLEYHNEHSSNLIIITAGQKPIQLAPRLRLRLQSLPLPYLTETQVQNKIQRLGIQVEENVVPEIFRLTQGHPLSVRLLVDLWRNDLNLKTIQQQLAHGINKLMSEVIEKTILNQLQLGSAYPEPKILLQYLVPLRYILRQTQRFMLAKFLPDYFANKPPIFADRLFTEFQKINLFDWKEGIGHTLNPVVRQLLLEEMRNNAKNEFIKIQTTLVEMYDNLTRENKGESQYFIEKVYHTAVLLTETTSDNINERLAGEMQSYLDTYFVSVALLTETDQKIISKLRNTLKADTELNQLIEVEPLLKVIDEFVTITPTEDEEEIKEEVKEEIIQPILPLVERIEITQFDNALQSDSPIRILAIDTEGQGGVGKTIFLLQMQERCISRPNEIVYSKELIDFFQLENRNKTGVMEQIAKHLELKTFLSIVKQFRTTEDVAEREKLSSELPTIFLQGYNKVAKRLHQEGKLLVLFFDSYEYIQSTSERKADSTNFSHWLETELFVQLAHPENARLVIAGRYQPIELSTACSERIHLSPFSFENTKEFLQRAFDCATEEQLVRHIAPIKVIKKFHHLAEAQPIFIALFVDWINSSNSSPEELLTEIENQTGEVSFPLTKNQKQFFEKKLIDNIYQLLETSQLIVTYLAVAYRRMTADILSWLTGEHKDRCEEDIDKFKRWSFIKQKPGNIVLLHDEMYRLLDSYFWKEDPQAYEDSLKHLVKYYDEELLSKTDLSEADRDTYTSELLEYAFQADFADGLIRFRNEFDFAMDDGKYDYSESLLREAENADNKNVRQRHNLDFLHIQLRRVNYGLETGAAVQPVLTQINAVITKYQRDSRWQHSEIQGQFLLSKGKAEFALAKYDSAIQAFTLAKQLFFDTGEDHWANWAINWIGYSYYQQGQFNEAENLLNRSQRSFNALLWESGTQHDALERRQILQGIQSSLGHLAMVYAMTGRFYQAVNNARIQLHIVRNLPRNSKEIARSLNAFALTLELTGNTIEAQAYALEALEILEKFNALSLIGQVKINLFWQGFHKNTLSYPLEYYRAEELETVVKKSKLDVATQQALLENEAIEMVKAPAYLAYGELLMVTKQFEPAKQALEKGLKYAINAQFQYHQIDALKNLVKLYYFWGTHAQQIEQYKEKLKQLNCEIYPELLAKYEMILGNIEFDNALNLFSDRYLDAATLQLRKAFIYYISAAEKLRTFSETRYHTARLIFHKRLSTFIQFALQSQLSTQIIDKRLEDIKLTWREETDFDQIHDYACLCVSPDEKLEGISALERDLFETMYRDDVSWVVLRCQCLIDAFSSLIALHNQRTEYHISLITWLIHHALFNHQLGYEYDATQSIVLAKEQLEELKFVAYADEQTPLLQIEIKSLEGRIHATEGTLLYRRAQYSDAAFYLRGELAEAKDKFDKQYPGARSHALRLLKKAEQLLQETIAASERLMERVDVDDEKEYLKQRALVEQEILGTIRCRIGELLTLNEQFQEKEDQLGALQYLEQALEDTQVRGKTYHWAEVVNNYLTAHYFAGDENESTAYDQKVLTYEKQLEEIGVFKERYPIFFGKLRLTQGNIIFSRYFQHSHGNVKKLRQMLRDYVESCDFMARTGSAQFSLAIRVLIVRIRMIRHKKTLEEIKKGLSGIWLDQPHLKKEELVTLIEFIQTMQNIIGYDVQS